MFAKISSELEQFLCFEDDMALVFVINTSLLKGDVIPAHLLLDLEGAVITEIELVRAFVEESKRISCPSFDHLDTEIFP